MKMPCVTTSEHQCNLLATAQIVFFLFLDRRIIKMPVMCSVLVPELCAVSSLVTFMMIVMINEDSV
jgi:hypothetical protein